MLEELLQPRTDAGAIAQWIAVLVTTPTLAWWLRRRGQGDAARFVLGLDMLAIAWFAVRAFH